MPTPNSVNGRAELANLIPVVISTKIYDALLQQNDSMATFFARDYEGEITQSGDTVKVNTIIPPVGQILDNDKQTFQSEEINISSQSIVADKTAVAAFEFTSMAQLQSEDFQQQAIDALRYSINLQLEQWIYSNLAFGQTLAPANSSLFTETDIGTLRTWLSKRYVPVTDRGLFLDPQYYGDLANGTKILSSDYADRSNNDGQTAKVTLWNNFAIRENNAMPADMAIAAHKSAFQLIMQRQPEVKISDLHVNRKLGFLMSVHMFFGGKAMDSNRAVKMTG